MIVQIREVNGKFEVWADMFEGKQQTPFMRKVYSSRDMDKAKKRALKLSPKVQFGNTDLYAS